VQLNFLYSLVIFGLLPSVTDASNKSILLQSTTSTENSGFYEYILPFFEKDTGIKVNVVAVGTGAAIKNAMNCDGDVLFVHSPKQEVQFISKGYSKKRFNVMFNDFLIIGPDNDPAQISNLNNVISAFKNISLSHTKFISRSDNSGTYHKEKEIWRKADIDPQNSSGEWYFEVGSGMGATLNMAVGINAYTLSDRASWIKFENKGTHKIIFKRDSLLHNPYSIMLVNKEKCPNVREEQGQIFINWLISKKGQRLISEFVVNGKMLFNPNLSMSHK